MIDRVASLKLGRRFTLCSAIIATTVVASLLGMAVYMSNDPYRPVKPHWAPERISPSAL